MIPKKQKGLFVAIYSDDMDSYVFDAKKDALKAVMKDMSMESIGVGTMARIYDLTKINPIKEIKKDLIIK